MCFYFARDGKLKIKAEENTQLTKDIALNLIGTGFMVDYAPGEVGSFFRVVVNKLTRRETLDRLILAIHTLGCRGGEI